MTYRITLHSTITLLGLGLLAACPPAGGDTDSATDTEADTSTTGDPTTTAPGPTTDPPTTTTVDPPTSTTVDPPTSTTVEPTTDPTTDPTVGPTTDDPSSTTDEPPPPLTLCDKLGGEAGINDLVGAAIGVILADDKVNGYFLNSDLDAGNLVTCLNKQLGELATCPGVVYDCADMKTAHAGLGIGADDFMDFAVDFSTALDAHQQAHPELTNDDKTAIMGALAGMAPDIVEDPNNDLTVYQRVGRKPAIKALVGKPGEATSFVDNVANNAAINGFFGASDFDRLNTCLTRQVAGIDGPIKYGLEVDAPQGVDPGAGAANPCLDMVTSHAGLVDANDMIGIDINDFGALVGDLVTAMNTFGVAQSDQDAILGVLGPLCGDILAPEFKNQCPGSSKLETVEVPMINQSPPDNGYNGMPASMLCVDVNVPADEIDFVQSVELTVAVNHVRASDLTIKVINPAGDTVLTVLSRPGLAEPADNGLGNGGTQADLQAAFPLTFKDGAANDAEQMGAGLGNTQVICKDDNIAPCEWAPSPGAGPGASFADFLGSTASGAWKVCFGDSVPVAIGVVGNVKLVIERVKYDPTP